jgi:hypothetical protein
MKKFAMPLLLLSAAFVTPAYANYFANPQMGVNLNIGSAPNPRPNDIRDNRMPVVEEAPAPASDITATASDKQDVDKTVNADQGHSSVPSSGGTAAARFASPAH